MVPEKDSSLQECQRTELPHEVSSNHKLTEAKKVALLIESKALF